MMKWKGDPLVLKPTEDAQVLAKRLKRPARVLLAEDDWAFRDLLLFAFHECGCEVMAARDAKTLVDALATSYLPSPSHAPFDLLISDIRMPGWRGLPALLEMIKSPLVPPVVLITAFGSEELHETARREGVVAVLDKPFDIKDLTALALNVVEHVQREARTEVLV
jgi:CheY-like chemotaxis protein